MKTKTILAALSAIVAVGIGAQEGTIDYAAERARIASERAQAQARFDAEEIACRARFAVNDCVARSKARLREILTALRRQELAVNSTERRQRGDERLRELEQRQRPAAPEGTAPAATKP